MRVWPFVLRSPSEAEPSRMPHKDRLLLLRKDEWRAALHSGKQMVTEAPHLRILPSLLITPYDPCCRVSAPLVTSLLAYVGVFSMSHLLRLHAHIYKNSLRRSSACLRPNPTSPIRRSSVPSACTSTQVRFTRVPVDVEHAGASLARICLFAVRPRVAHRGRVQGRAARQHL